MTADNIKQVDLAQFLSNVKATDPIFEGIPRLNFDEPSKANPYMFEQPWKNISQNILHPFAPKDAAVITKHLVDGNTEGKFSRSKVLQHNRDNSLNALAPLNQLKGSRKRILEQNKGRSDLGTTLVYNLLKGKATGHHNKLERRQTIIVEPEKTHKTKRESKRARLEREQKEREERKNGKGTGARPLLAHRG